MPKRLLPWFLLHAFVLAALLLVDCPAKAQDCRTTCRTDSGGNTYCRTICR